MGEKKNRVLDEQTCCIPILVTTCNTGFFFFPVYMKGLLNSSNFMRT